MREQAEILIKEKIKEEFGDLSDKLIELIFDQAETAGMVDLVESLLNDIKKYENKKTIL